MSAQLADAFPAKRFFVDMLTRDIDLQDAILDLLDNCVDGAMRMNNVKKPANARLPYKGFSARIEFSNQYFRISDDCGGIPRDVAEESAFRMGRKDSNKDKDIPTVGVYGIGMKRAIFKMGHSAKVTSKTDASTCFQVVIDRNWMDDDASWKLPISDVPATDLNDGTYIEVNDLRGGIARLFSDNTGFVMDLKKAIAAYYGYIIEKGFQVFVNDEPILPQQVSLLFDENGLKKNTGMSPYIYQLEQDGVKVDLVVGIYRELPGADEEEDALAGKPRSERAGWTIICNDRVVIYADKSRTTGWGEAGVPAYHTQFVSIAGVVVFRSNNPEKLPITTTKRGIDGNSELYLGIKDFMREGLKVFTSYTNNWKKSSLERLDLNSLSKSAHAESIPALVGSSYFTKVNKGLGGQKFRPILPQPTNDNPVKQIRFSRTESDIRLIGEYLFEDSSAAAGDVGAACFDDVLRKAKL